MIQQKYNIHLEISSLYFKISLYTSTQIQKNIIQQKYNIHKTRQMPSINIERVGVNSKLIMTIYKISIFNITCKFW